MNVISFHGDVLTMEVTPNQLSKLLTRRKSDNYKSFHDFNGVTDDGIEFTIYDWKLDRKLDEFESYNHWHIGAYSPEDSKLALEYLKSKL